MGVADTQLPPVVGPHSHLVSDCLQHPILKDCLPGPLLHPLSSSGSLGAEPETGLQIPMVN